MKSFLKYLLVLLSGFIVIIVTLFIFMTVIGSSEPTVPDEAWLDISLSGTLDDYVAPNPFNELTQKRPLSMQSLRDIMEKAAVDERIHAVLLRFDFAQPGLAQTDEIRAIIRRYRESGKKIYAWFPFAFTREYLMASACDSVYMPVAGNLFLSGISSESVHYKELLEKIGVEAEYVHAGRYKSAPEQYTRRHASPEHKEAVGRILDQAFDYMVSAIAADRSLQAPRVTKLINDVTGFTAQGALQSGLIDDVRGLEWLKERFRKNGWKRYAAQDYARLPASSLKIRDKERIVVVEVEGVIASGAAGSNPFTGKTTGSAEIIKAIHNAAESKSTRAIMLRINSPGGVATTADAIYEAVARAREKKPVIASISDYGASGGYYIALAADTLIAQPLSLVGSIGVFAGKFNMAGLSEKAGIGVDVLKRGQNATLFSIYKPWSNAERTVMQGLIDEFYQHFVRLTAKERKMPIDTADKLAQGRVWSGEDAVQSGLTDITGSFYDALAVAKQKAGIPTEHSVRLVWYPGEKDWLGSLSRFIASAPSLEQMLREKIESFKPFQNRALALWPYKIVWQ